MHMVNPMHVLSFYALLEKQLDIGNTSPLEEFVPRTPRAPSSNASVTICTPKQYEPTIKHTDIPKGGVLVPLEMTAKLQVRVELKCCHHR